jgi:F-type H+-transporting ATPase subunit delta
VDATDGMTGKQVEAAAKDFIRLLAERQELYRVREVLRAIDAVWREKYGAANVNVTTAYPISKDLRAAIEKAAGGASVTETVEPALIGGARIRIDDRLIDGTVAGHLDRLRNVLTE